MAGIAMTKSGLSPIGDNFFAKAKKIGVILLTLDPASISS